MTIAFLITLALLLGMGIALYFQMKAGRKQAEEQEQLLKDYQRRVDEQQKLLDDYRALEKYFDSVGEGYEQALLAFDKMDEETQKAKQANEALEKRCAALQEELNSLQHSSSHQAEVMAPVLADLQQIVKTNSDPKLMALVGKLSDMGDIEGDQPISRIDNVLVQQIADDAVKASGIDKIDYLKFNLQVAPDAAATMLSTNVQKATRALFHLLDNALKFTTEGSVTLSVAVDMIKMQAIYTVEDTGSGIEAADTERIFEPYVKLNQFFDGQGVGLTVARNIARRLGGDLIFDADFAGPGSRFVLTLPI